METQRSPQREYSLDFFGKGSEYFAIVIVNWLLTALTLGIYYPWAKARQLEYLYSQTYFEDDNFTFHGTGKEMFIGFIKAIGIFIGLAAIVGIFVYMGMGLIGGLLFYLGIFAILPLAIHGSYRYRMSRTSWRGIRFGYRGERNVLFTKFIKGLVLTIITLGIYGAWFAIDIRNYVLSHIRFGDMKFKYQASGTDFFVLNLKGYFLTIFTLGIYMFWWQKDLFEFYVNHLSIQKDEEEIRFHSFASGGDFFGLIFVNILIVIFTLGLGFPWVVTRTLKFITGKIDILGNIDTSNIQQTEEAYFDATGEDVADFLDFDIII